MPPELDFKTLRAQVEAATRMPDFAGLWHRARRVRFRDRLAVLGAMFGTLAVFIPVAIASIIGRPTYQPSPVGPDNSIVDESVPAPQHTGEQKLLVTVRAAGGVLPDNLFAAVDVCDEGPARRCNLQVAALRAGAAGSRTPIVTNALRDDPTDRLDDVQLVPLSRRSILLSGVVGGQSRTSVRISATGPATADQPASTLALQPGDRAVQLGDAGDIYGVRQADGALSLLDRQPALGQRTAVAAVPPDHGWWVTGVDPDAGRPAIGVSRDQGRDWTVRSLPAPAGQLDVPTLATLDGVTAHAFVRYSTGIRHFRTTDGGLTWTEITKRIQLPGTLSGDGALAGRRFGAVARADGSVLLWIQDVTAPVFLNSTDGVSYGAFSGPAAGVVAVDGGYVTLSDRPALSLDCMNWATADLPPPVQPR
jgi:hypothetical protein